ncbi:AbrB/MazE/SpoVT family DNA-binding domain-containing protein [Candidatus Pacearchaeota archaeon]|nr:AbrB/MazE/SpoVT family DNA-binding domain-containing protein [Candidatus Pacearchaeota archaeon]
MAWKGTEKKGRAYVVKLTRWGLNLGLRIPKSIVRKYQLSDGEEVSIEEKKNSLEIKKINTLEPHDNYSI